MEVLLHAVLPVLVFAGYIEHVLDCVRVAALLPVPLRRLPSAFELLPVATCAVLERAEYFVG